MTPAQEAAEIRQLLINLQAARNSTARYVLDSSPAKAELLAGLDGLIGRARAHLARAGHPIAPPVAEAPEAVQ
jgi:hypothetical protein